MELKQFEPFWRWIIVEPILPEKTSTGIYLANQNFEDPRMAQHARVLKVGREVQMVEIDQIVAIEDVSRAKRMQFDDCKGREIYAIQEMQAMGAWAPLIDEDNDSIRTSPSD